MANLETLELTINGSAQSASEGIDKLITSLSSLSDALAKPYSDLRDFNAALKETAEYCKVLKDLKGIKLPNISQLTGASGAKKGAKGTPWSAEDEEEFARSQSLLDTQSMKLTGTLGKLGKALGATTKDESKIGSLVDRYRGLADSVRELAGTDLPEKSVAESWLEKNDKITRMRAQQAETVKKLSIELEKPLDQQNMSKIDSLASKYDRLTASIERLTKAKKASNAASEGERGAVLKEF